MALMSSVARATMVPVPHPLIVPVKVSMRETVSAPAAFTVATPEAM